MFRTYLLEVLSFSLDSPCPKYLGRQLVILRYHCPCLGCAQVGLHLQLHRLHLCIVAGFAVTGIDPGSGATVGAGMLYLGSRKYGCLSLDESCLGLRHPS